MDLLTIVLAILAFIGLWGIYSWAASKNRNWGLIVAVIYIGLVAFSMLT